MRVVGSKVVVDGELDHAERLRKSRHRRERQGLREITSSTSRSFRSKAMSSIAKRIQQDVNSFAPNITTRVVNGVVFLEGTVDNIDQDKRAAERRHPFIFLTYVRTR